MHEFIIEDSIQKTCSSDMTDHTSVMMKEVLQCLQPEAKGVYVDATLGMGGHAKALLQKIGPQGRLVAIDKDKNSLDMAKRNLQGFEHQCDFIHEHFCYLDSALKKINIERVDGILFDFGISSFQLDDESRGFSFQNSAPLDMRINRDIKLTAFDLVNSLSEYEISIILRDYGQERFHQRIAKSIVKRRAVSPIKTTTDLSDIISRCMPRKKRREKIHPATRSFQAFRIAVNRELEEIEMALDKCIDLLKSGGKIVTIAFHSLEDRIVKNKFRMFAKMNQIEILTKKPIRPTEEEVQHNTRARSARLRGAKRI